MDKKSFTRVMIETVVDRGIRDVTDDPKRSLRRLAEMGKQFSEGRFQKASFGHITNLLKNDDSPYYKMLEDFLATVDHKVIKTFGLNMGFDSWTYGARLIRHESEQRGYMLPWVVQIHYDDEDKNRMDINDIDNMVEKLSPLGVNTYVIKKQHGLPDDPHLIKMLENHPGCAFYIFPDEADISMNQAEAIKNIGNTVLSVNIASKNAMSSCKALRELKTLYVIHYQYVAEEVDRFSDAEYIDSWLSYGSAFIFLIQKDSDKGLAGKFAKRTRMQQEYPILVWDIYSDIRLVNEMISDIPFIFEISSDGDVIYPANSNINILDTDIITALEKTAPPFKPLV